MCFFINWFALLKTIGTVKKPRHHWRGFKQNVSDIFNAAQQTLFDTLSPDGRSLKSSFLQLKT